MIQLIKICIFILITSLVAACSTGFKPKSDQDYQFQVLPDDSIYQMNSEWFNQDGKKIHLSDFRGNPVVISMVYMSCKYSCPLTVNYMKEVENKLTPQMRNKIQFVLVSFDPEHDTPQKMIEFSVQHKLLMPPWHFITTPKEQDIRELSALLDFKYKKTDDGGFEHSFSIIALDRNGVIKVKLDGVGLKPLDILPYLVNTEK